VALDVDATRDLLAKQATQDVAENAALRDQAEREAAKAEAALARVERDYLDGKLSVEKWEHFEAKLTAELEGARAQIEQHDRQRAAIEAQAAEFDAEAAIVNELAALRQTVVGQIRAGREGNVEQLRSVLRRLFTDFELMMDQAGPSGYSLRPGVRLPRLADGRYDWEATQAGGTAVQRVALDFSDNLCSLLAAW
jgi:hypothetical protein